VASGGWARSRIGGLALVGLSALAAAVALAIRHWLYPLGSINHDEPMYVFSARLLAHGHATLPATYAPFRPWASGLRGGSLVMKYTPAWPAVLAVAAKLGSMQIALAGTAAGAVALMGVLGRSVCGRRREGLLAAAILLASPLFFLQSGTYLPYAFQLLLDLAVLVLVLDAVRRSTDVEPLPRGVVVRFAAAGALWGVACFARPYDALLLAVPIVIAVVVALRRRLPRILAAAGWSVLGAAAPIVVLLAYNRALMGGPLRSPFSITGPDDRLGFGTRGVFTTSAFHFTAHDGLTSLRESLVQLPGWAFGGVLLVALALFGLWRQRARTHEVIALGGLAVVVAAGYAVFWSPYSIVRLWPGAHTMGPFYHLALLIPLAVFGAAGIGAVIDRSRVAGAVTLVLLVAITAATVGSKIDRNRRVKDDERAVQLLVEHANLGRAVLFMDDRGTLGFESAAPFLENTPTLDRPVLYAADDGPGDFAVLDRFPARTAARMRTELRPGDALLDPTRFVERLHVARGRSVTLRFRIVNTAGTPTVVATLHAGAVARSLVLDRGSTRGKSYDVSWTVFAARARPQPFRAVVLPAARGTVEVEAVFSGPGRVADRYQRRYPYAVAGGEARVLTPGWGRYLFRYGKPVWVNQDVAPTLTELP
jgi:4-amino-4-deoxy-L-arabinose transferase-like glycosyltransferase